MEEGWLNGRLEEEDTRPLNVISVRHEIPTVHFFKPSYFNNARIINLYTIEPKYTELPKEAIHRVFIHNGYRGMG